MVIWAKGGNCIKWAKISLHWPNLWFPFSLCSSSGLWRLFHMQTPSLTAPQPHLFYSQTFSSPLHPICANNTPLTAPPHSQQASVEFIQIFWHFASPHFPSRNDLWQLEMGSVGGASSNTLPSFFPPVLLCRKADFSLSTPIFFSTSFIHRCSSCQLAKALKAPLVFFSMWLHSVIDKLGDIPLFVDILYLLSFFVCLLPSAHLLFDPVLTPCMAAQRVILLWNGFHLNPLRLQSNKMTPFIVFRGQE